MSKINDRVLGHADDNDGIEEYDNPLPDWWVGMFFFTIVFAIGYSVEYHLISQRSQASMYVAEMEAAKAQWPESDVPQALAFDADTLEAGEEVFAQTCASCHAADLTGGIGPSLVDAEWIHGAEEQQVLTTVTEGVAAKGMPAWGPVLGPDKVSKVTAFVVSKFRATGLEPVAAGGGQQLVPDEEPPPALDEAAEEAVADAMDAEPGDPIALGEQIFVQNCVACHGADMTGNIGPNLIDDEWIHGGELEDIKKVITDGVPEKGMVSWGPILGDEKVEHVARFVHEKANGG